MSNLGMQIIYREVNGREDWLCERASCRTRTS